MLTMRMKSFIEMELNFTSVFKDISSRELCTCLSLDHIHAVFQMVYFHFMPVWCMAWDCQKNIPHHKYYPRLYLRKVFLTLRISNWHFESSSDVKISALWSGVLINIEVSTCILNCCSWNPNVRKYGTPVQFHHHICIS